MMTLVSLGRSLAFTAAVATLVSCTNTREDQSVLTFGQTLQRSLSGADRAPVPDRATVQAAVQQAVAATDRPLALFSLEDTGAVALITPIERNGPYETWASFGSSERRSVTVRSGLVTSTRGLGGDLMSSNVSDLLRSLNSVTGKQSTQVLRHLDGQNIIVETVATCTIKDKQQHGYSFGALNQTVTKVSLTCESGSLTFDNHYLVSRNGRILEARQWLGPVLGMSVMQQLR